MALASLDASSRSRAGRSSSSPARSFPALHRLEEVGLAGVDVGGVGEQPPREVLHADQSRQRQLGEATEQWNRVALAMTKALEA